MHFLAQGPIVWEPTTGREEEAAQTPEGSEVEKGEGHDNILLLRYPTYTHTTSCSMVNVMLDFVFSARRQRC